MLRLAFDICNNLTQSENCSQYDFIINNQSSNPEVFVSFSFENSKGFNSAYLVLRTICVILVFKDIA